MYKKIFSSLELPLQGDILGVSGLKYFIGSKNYKPPMQIISKDAKITQANYPDVNMCNLPYPDNSFDVVVADQVIEHIEGNIEQAISECHRVLKTRGMLIIGTVFIHPIHWGPKDMWRFSTAALKYLCRDFSEIVECGSWGNKWIHALFFLYENARDWDIPERRFNVKHFFATLNDTKYPLNTWIIARK
ncbi:MAG: class I SAM-dependent methyltransferase [Patescibacteria group bacterium]